MISNEKSKYIFLFLDSNAIFKFHSMLRICNIHTYVNIFSNSADICSEIPNSKPTEYSQPTCLTNAKNETSLSLNDKLNLIKRSFSFRIDLDLYDKHLRIDILIPSLVNY